MNSLLRLGWLWAGSLVLSGCFSITDTKTLPASAPTPAAVNNTVQQKKNQLKADTANAFSLPEALGGVIASDRWVIYKEKEEEAFEGHVSYDNGIYIFRADYALSQRKQNRISAQGQVFIRKNDPDKSFYELYADKADYNYKTNLGKAQAAQGKTIRLVYQSPKGTRLTASAQKAQFNTAEEWCLLEGKVRITHTDEQGQTATLSARRVTMRLPEQYLLLEGDAKAQKDTYTLKAQNLVYEGPVHQAAAYGGRPLAQGATPDGTFAIIADRAETDTETRKIKLSGRVQGWTVSEQINASKANQHF